MSKKRHFSTKGLYRIRFCNAAREIKSCSQVAIDVDLARHEIGGRNHFVKSDMYFNGVTGAYHALEFGTIDSRSNRDRAIVGSELAEQNGAALQATFAKDHARYKWKAWEMALYEEVFARKGLFADDVFVCLLDHFIDEQHWLSMGYQRLNLILVGNGHI